MLIQFVPKCPSYCHHSLETESSRVDEHSKFKSTNIMDSLFFNTIHFFIIISAVNMYFPPSLFSRSSHFQGLHWLTEIRFQVWKIFPWKGAGGIDFEQTSSISFSNFLLFFSVRWDTTEAWSGSVHKPFKYTSSLVLFVFVEVPWHCSQSKHAAMELPSISKSFYNSATDICANDRLTVNFNN